MVRCVGLFVLLCAFSLVLGESFLFSGAGEASLCRSYFTAKDEGLIEKCKYLWLYATVFQSDIESIDCQSCKNHLKNKDYSALSKILKKRQVILRNSC